MKIRSYLAASAAAASLAAFGLAASAQAADNIVLNQWYTGFFTGTPSPLQGGGLAAGTHGPVLPGGFANAIAAPQSPWTITLTGAGTLTVTDIETSGDRFQLFDNGIPMTPAASPFHGAGQNPGQAGLPLGFTSIPVPNASFGVTDINAALGNADYSSGTFLLHSGVNNITGEFLGTIGFGDFDFIAESAVPEPATWAMLLVGVGSLGLLLRSRRREAVAAA